MCVPVWVFRVTSEMMYQLSPIRGYLENCSHSSTRRVSISSLYSSRPGMRVCERSKTCFRFMVYLCLRKAHDQERSPWSANRFWPPGTVGSQIAGNQTVRQATNLCYGAFFRKSRAFQRSFQNRPLPDRFELTFCQYNGANVPILSRGNVSPAGQLVRCHLQSDDLRQGCEDLR